VDCLLRRLWLRAGLLTNPSRRRAAPLPTLPDLRHAITATPLTTPTFKDGARPLGRSRPSPHPGEVVNVTPRCRCGRLLRATAGWMARCEVCRNGRCPAVYQGRRCRRPVGHRGLCQ